MANKFECPPDMEEVTIYEFGASNLKGRTMHTDKGAKVIDRIRPYKYKACTVYFIDGTEQRRDYDEPFRIMKDPLAGKLGVLAELASYGIDWVRDVADDNIQYATGGYETVAHIIACAVVQWVTNDSMPTSDVVEELGLEDYPSRDLLTRRFKDFIQLCQRDTTTPTSGT